MTALVVLDTLCNTSHRQITERRELEYEQGDRKQGAVDIWGVRSRGWKARSRETVVQGAGCRELGAEQSFRSWEVVSRDVLRPPGSPRAVEER